VDQFTRCQLRVGRTNSFELDRPDAERQRLSDTGTVLTLAKGFYALVPEDRRGESTTWGTVALSHGELISESTIGSTTSFITQLSLVKRQ
jgi:hypothetical protein